MRALSSGLCLAVVHTETEPVSSPGAQTTGTAATGAAGLPGCDPPPLAQDAAASPAGWLLGPPCNPVCKLNRAMVGDSQADLWPSGADPTALIALCGRAGQWSGCEECRASRQFRQLVLQGWVLQAGHQLCPAACRGEPSLQQPLRPSVRLSAVSDMHSVFQPTLHATSL